MSTVPHIARILTATVLGGVFVALVILPPPWVFALSLGLFALVGVWEWARLALLSRPRACACLLVFSLLLLVVYHWVSYSGQQIIILLAMGAWLGALVLSLCLLRASSKPLDPGQAASLTIGLGVLLSAWLALVFLSRQGEHSLLLLLLLSVWALDSGCWWVGSRWGRRRLVPAISPGKTWEGLWGGLATGLAVVVLGVLWQDRSPGEILLLLVLAFFSLCGAIVGDLFESMLKRTAGCKDSGFLLPGHGGLLDRIDGLCAAAPIWVGGLILGGQLP